MSRFGPAPARASGSSHQWLDNLLSEDGVGCQLFHTISRGAVTAGSADTFHHGFAADLDQIVRRTPRVVGFEFRSSDFAQFSRQIGDRKTSGFGTQGDDGCYHTAHPDQD